MQNDATTPAQELNTIDVSLKPTALVTQSNILLNGQLNLNTVEMRFFFAMLACIDRNDTELKRYRIKVSDIIDLTNLKSGKHLFSEISQHIEHSMRHVVKLNGEDRTMFRNIYYSADYIQGQGIIEVAPHPDLRPYLLELKENFTTALLSQLMSFKSIYSTRLYLLIKQFKKAGYRVMSIEDLRFSLCLSFSEQRHRKVEQVNLYPLYADLKRWVLHPAQKELETSDIPFKMKEIKQGRKVVAIKFTITEAGSNESQILNPIAVKHEQVYNRMLKLGLSDFQAREILKTVTVREINKTCFDIELQLKNNYTSNGKPIANPSAYAYGSFKKKFGIQ